MNVNNVTRWTYIHHLPTFHNTCKHILGTYASFLGIPAISGSFFGETLDRGTRRSTPVAFSVRGLTNGVFYFIFGLFRTYVHGKQMLGLFFHKMASGRQVAGVSTYRSMFLPSVSILM